MWEMHPHFSLKLHYHLTFFLIYVFYFISLSLSSLSLSLSLSVSLTLSFSCMCLCRPVKGIRYFIARVTRDCELSHRDAGNWTWPLCDISAHLPSACTPSIYSPSVNSQNQRFLKEWTRVYSEFIPISCSYW